MLTLIDILRRSEDYLRDNGVKDARRNAELLAAHVLGKSRLDLYVEHDRPMQEDELKKMRDALAQRKGRRPIQYIFGETEFYGLPMKLSPEVLIPRPETELLVEEALKRLESAQADTPVVYDVGTGSGCIAIAIAKNCGTCRVVASDPSAEALKVASANAASNGVSERIDFLHGSFFKPFRNAGTEKADIVAANPPYIKSGDIAALEPEVRDHEPIKALDGGEDGLDIIRTIVAEASENMKDNAWLIMEMGTGQSRDVEKLIETTGAFDTPGIRKDYQDIDRIITAKLKRQAA